LQSAVVNSHIGMGDLSRDMASNRSVLDSEIVDFVIIHKPYTSITSPSNILYSLDFATKGNILFRPSPQSALAFNLYNKSVVPHTLGIPHETPYKPDLRNWAFKGL
jgi:hypothetical protein